MSERPRDYWERTGGERPRAIGSRLRGRYELRSVLGRGGMGVVYRAHDPELDREVAVKMIPPTALSDEAEGRFRREARLVARLDHPAITPIYDFGVDDGSLFLVMPVLEGDTLDDLIKRGALRLGETLEIIAQAAEALDHSHRRGILHRDIKPENLMVTRQEGRDPRVRIMDFGLAVARRADRLTKTGQVFGTLAYVSPERAGRGGEEDARSDIYALAAVLYECLAGEPPFTGQPASLVYRIAHEQPQGLRDRGIAVDAELEWIVLGCLAKDPDQRLQRGNELAAALRRYRATLEDRAEARADRPTARMPGVPASLRAAPPRPPLIGRDAELQALQRRLQAAHAGRRQLAVIGGAAGIGKSRLVEELAALARARDIPVFSGRFVEGEAALPYQGFSELIQDALARRPDADLGDLAGDLVRTFPQLGEVPELAAAGAGARPPARLEDLQTQRAEAFDLLARTLARLGDGAPLVLVLEGLHAAEPSLEALRYVVHRLSSTPTLFLATYRSEEVGVGHPLRRLLAAFEGDPSCQHLLLAPLDAADHRALVRALIDDQPLADELAERLHESTEGNPLFTRELVRSMMEAGSLARDDSGTWILSGEAATAREVLPETIQQVVSARLERLPPAQRRLLATASVIGRAMDYEDLEALVTATGEDPATVEPAIDALIDGGLLVERAEGRGERLQFASGVVRDVLYGGLGGRRRRLLHRRHAEHLERRWAGRLERVHPQLLHHFAGGDVAEKTIHYGRVRARAALDAFAIREAIRAARLALAFIADIGDTADIADAGDIAGAREETARARGELLHLLALALRADGRLEAAQREAERAADALDAGTEAGAAPEAARALLLAAEIAWQTRRTERTRALIERGVALARGAGEPAVERRLLLLGATVANLQGRHTEAQAWHQEAAALASSTAGSEPDPDEGAGGDGGVLVTALPNPVTVLEPGLHEVVEDTEVLATVFETLVRSGEDGTPVPGLTDSWRVEDGGRVFHFVLRPDVRFADGTPLTAEAVKESLERAARGRPQSIEVAAFDAIAGDASGLSGVVVEDPATLRFELLEPLPIFPILLSDPGTAIARRGADGTLVGTGPFRLGKRDEHGVEVVRNRRWWGGAPARLDGVRFRTDLDADGIAAALREGELDIGRDLPAEALIELQRDPRIGTAVEIVERNVYFLLFNLAGPAGLEAAARRALAGVLRVQDLVWRTLGPSAQPALGLIPPGLLGHDPGRRRVPLSLEQAGAALDAAGVTRPLVLRAGIHPQWLDRYRALTDAVLEVWASLGVEVEIVAASLESYLPLASACDAVDLLLGRWFADYDDPDNFTYGLLHSTAGHYRCYWGSAEADALLERARLERRRDVRVRLYHRIERRIAEQGVMLPLFHEVDYRIPGPRVRGLRLSASPPFVDYRRLSLVSEDDGRTSAVHTFPERGTVRISLPHRMVDLDPAQALMADAAEVVPNVFETLLRVEEGARVVPWLAAAYRLEDGGRRLALELRRDVRFHDGRRLSVRDVRYSFERLLRSPLPGTAAKLLAIRGARAFRDGEADEIAGLRLEAARAMTIELETPMACFPNLLSTPVTAIVPEGSDTFAGNWRRGCAGTGPFRLISFHPTERVELEADPDHWRPGAPRCERLIFELTTEREAMLEGFRAGRLALASHLAPGDVAPLLADPELAPGYAEAPGLGTYYLLLDCQRGPLADVEIRRSLAALLDVDALVARHVGRLGRPAHGLIPPGLPGHEPMPRSSGVTVVRPVSLAGVTLRIGLHPAYRSRYDTLWQAIAEVWSAAGVTLEVRVLSGGEVLSAEETELDVLATRWLADYPDPDSFASLLHSRDGLDRALCQDPEVDRLIEEGRREREPALRHAVYRELERSLVRAARVVPLFYEQTVCFARPEVIGLRFGFGRPEVAYEDLRRLM